ncbi:hypothetical protein [Spiroplasma taiwanense]|uniref:PTS EIIB type-1 domain-containing protein n=1 Tax=Spiroplasma taiwanense CT-1 TaxID=1276220 RepID=S5LT88_9MOLU|nr:hypothetical protein [Spiroplasma taiwanense]AGR40914.1 hypothetical protein STAIW_v1c02500 [Spiroplasma taiwanense CT-1]
MVTTVLILVAILFVVCSITLLIYISTRKIVIQKNSLDKLENIPSVFTFKNIVKALGGFENIVEVKDKKVKIVVLSLINKKHLKILGIKWTLEEDFILMSVTGFNLNLFLLKLERELKNFK